MHDRDGALMLSHRELGRFFIDRHRQSEQHPDDGALARMGVSRGEHYRHRNNGMAYRTFLGVQGRRPKLWALRRDRHSASVLVTPKDSRGLRLALECGYAQFNCG